jgi:hypothetical protein
VWKSARLSLKQEELERYQERQPISDCIAQSPTKNKHLETFMNDILNMGAN